MDWVLKQTFNHFLKAFCEPLAEDGIQLSFVDGIVVKDLIVRPDAINAELERNNADLRIEGGKIGFMRMCYTTVPGIVTMQMSEVDIRVRPNAMRTIGKAMKKQLMDWVSPEPIDGDDYPMVNYPPRVPRGISMISQPYCHDPLTCPNRFLSGYYCPQCALPYSPPETSAVYRLARTDLPVVDFDTSDLYLLDQPALSKLAPKRHTHARRNTTSQASSNYSRSRRSMNAIQLAGSRLQTGVSNLPHRRARSSQQVSDYGHHHHRRELEVLSSAVGTPSPSMSPFRRAQTRSTDLVRRGG